MIGTGDEEAVGAALRAADVILLGPGSDELVDPAVVARHRRADAGAVTISPFGCDGPLAGAPADEFTLQAWCGLMSGCGTRDTPPLQMGIGHGLWATGAMAALAALAGRAASQRSGDATDVEVAALEVMAVCLTNYPPLYRDFTGQVAVMSRGGDWPQIVRCKDGWIGLCVFTPQQWADFADMIGRPDLSADDRLNSMRGRGQHRELAESVIRPWLEQHTAAEIHELGGLFRVPVAFVGNGRDVLDMSHFVERGVFSGLPPAPRPPLRVELAPVPDARAPRTASSPDDRPLAGVTIVDFTAFWAGPAATHLLATLGADVVKIESPTRPDGMRFATTRPPSDPEWVEYSPTFHGTNPGKRSVTIDFSTPRGRELVLRLVEHADVVVENFTPRVMPNVGLDDVVLRARRPDLVMLRMPAFGARRPVARPQRVRADDRAGVGHRVAHRHARDRPASPLDRRPDRRHPRRVRGAGRARAPPAYGRRCAARAPHGRGRAQRCGRADPHVVGVRHLARAPGQSRAARRAAGRVRVRG